MKKLIAAVLCLLMVAALAGCGVDSALIGTWKMDMSSLDAMNAADSQYGTNFANYKTEVRLDGVTVTFDDGGKMITEGNVDQIEACVLAFMDEYTAYIENGGLYALFRAEGIREDEVDVMLEAQGMTMEKIIEQHKDWVKTSFQSHELAEGIARVLVGEVKDGKAKETVSFKDDGTQLTLTQNGTDKLVTYTLEGDKLTLTAGENTFVLIRK